LKITGSYTIDAPREQVWVALNDMDVLARIVPGCERLVQTAENEFEGTIKIGIQSIKGTYSGKIRLADIQPPHHYKLIASGRSANGVVDGSGTVDLEEQDGKTVLTYGGDAQIGGTLASVGQRLIEGASKQLINQSLKALVEQIAARNNPSAPADSAPAASPQNGAAPAESRHAQGATAIAAEVEQARPASASVQPAFATSPPPPQDSFESRTVIVPEHEQLKPESIVRGIVDDMLKERPWLPWVVMAFLLGFLFGRRGR
jgi:uncharacterized protein